MTRFLPAVVLCTLVLAMMPGATAAGFAQREEVRAFIDEMHERHGFDRTRLMRLFDQAQPQPRAIQAILPPKDPSVRSWQAYRARFIEPSRIEGGLRFWEANQQTLEAARLNYGIPEEIIVAIIGIETIYGRNMGKFPALSRSLPPRTGSPVVIGSRVPSQPGCILRLLCRGTGHSAISAQQHTQLGCGFRRRRTSGSRVEQRGRYRQHRQFPCQPWLGNRQSDRRTRTCC